MTTEYRENENQEILHQSLISKPGYDPVEFFDKITDLTHSAHTFCAIAAAARLGVFDVLVTPQSMATLAGFVHSPDMLEPLLQILVQNGLVTQNQDTYVCSPLAREFLSRQSPYSQISYLEKQLFHLSDLWMNLDTILRSGPNQYEEEEFFLHLSLPSMAANALTGRLQDVVCRISELPRFESASKMLDLGGGHGLYALALAVKNPDLHAVVFDLPHVTALARATINRYGLESRVTVSGGNFFTDSIGSGYDLILSSSNPSGKSPDFVQTIAEALQPGGYFINIQPGDSSYQEDPCARLEWELWTFQGSDQPKSCWGKKKGFLTPEYQVALNEAGFDIISTSQIQDPYMKGFSVTMVIAEKQIV